ncbi:Polyprotein [Arachis hypogaea]|nr:Polyprotein [Arachis hypogaea]
MRYFGPFKICRKLSAMAYKLALPPEAKIHNVFHISALKKFRGEKVDHYLPLPLCTTELGPLLEPQEILGTRTVIKDGKEIIQLRIKWGQGPSANTSWESADDLRHTYPDFNLEDKVVVDERGNVTNGKKAEHVEVNQATYT